MPEETSYFSNGSITFRRFLVIGQASTPDQATLDKLASHQLQEADLGAPEEVEYGWCGGGHIFDGRFDFEHNVFIDCVVFALRIDTNRVPAELKKAYQIMEEKAVASNNPSGFISRKQKRDVKDIVRRKIEDDLRTGKFRRSKLVPVLWDMANQVLYSPCSVSAQDKLMELFERTFGLELVPESAGTLALRYLLIDGKTRDYEDSRPTRFSLCAGNESHWPEYPWVTKGPEPKDFLGNEFLLWLWHESDARIDRSIQIEGGQVSLLVDKLLDLDCAYGQAGRDLLRGDGPTQMPEAREALRSGKVPRRLGLILESRGSQFEFTFSGESFAISSAKFPIVDDVDNPRVLFEERIILLRDFCKILDGLYRAFLKVRTNSSWEGQTDSIRKWIQGGHLV